MEYKVLHTLEKDKGGKIMKKVTEKFLGENIGKRIIVVELVLNDKNETSTNDLTLVNTIAEANKLCEDLNERNNDKNYKYIVVEYTIQDDLSLEV